MIGEDEARLMDVQQGGLCFLCGQPVGAKATFDHLIPQAYGGADIAANVVLVHRRCNQKKAADLPSDGDIDRFVALRRGSRLGVWPPLLALRRAGPDEDEWMVLARAVAAAKGE
jgi:hypothetical protein